MKSMLKGLRALLTVCVCALLVFLTVVPSAAFAVPMKGEASDTAKSYEGPAKTAIDEGGPQSLERIQERQAGGLNEIQGTEGYEHMKNPDNTQAQSIEGQIKKGLEKLENNAKGAADSAKDLAR